MLMGPSRAHEPSAGPAKANGLPEAHGPPKVHGLRVIVPPCSPLGGPECTFTFLQISSILSAPYGPKSMVNLGSYISLHCVDSSLL